MFTVIRKMSKIILRYFSETRISKFWAVSCQLGFWVTEKVLIWPKNYFSRLNSHLVLRWISGYSDYDVFKENDKGSHGYEIDVKNNSNSTSVKHVFQNFEPFLASWVFELQKKSLYDLKTISLQNLRWVSTQRWILCWFQNCWGKCE